MKEQLIREVQRQMLPYLNNAQLKQLQSVLEGVLSGVELSHSAGMVESAKVDTVVCFINAKRIEGCSEKTLSYYRQTIVSMLSGIDKEPQEIVTEDLRKYLTEYQTSRKSSMRRGYMEPPSHRKHLLPCLRVVDAQGDLGVGVGQRVTKGDAADDRACGTV